MRMQTVKDVRIESQVRRIVPSAAPDVHPQVVVQAAGMLKRENGLLGPRQKKASFVATRLATFRATANQSQTLDSIQADRRWVAEKQIMKPRADDFDTWGIQHGVDASDLRGVKWPANSQDGCTRDPASGVGGAASRAPPAARHNVTDWRL